MSQDEPVMSNDNPLVNVDDDPSNQAEKENNEHQITFELQEKPELGLEAKQSKLKRPPKKFTCRKVGTRSQQQTQLIEYKEPKKIDKRRLHKDKKATLLMMY